MQADGEITPRNLREALLCCAALDLPGVDHSRGYIQAWWGSGNPIPERSAQRMLEGRRSDPESRDDADGGPLMRAAVYAARQYRRPGAGEPAAGAAAVRPGARLDGRRVRRSRRESGAKDRRPALDRLLADARRRRFDVLVCWRLDRLGRNLKHLITLLDELQALGVAFVSLAEGIDATTPAGKLQMHILGAIAEFERERIRERVLAGLQRARREGKRLQRVAELTAEVAAERLVYHVRRLSAGVAGVPNPSTRQHWRTLKRREDNARVSKDSRPGDASA